MTTIRIVTATHFDQPGVKVSAHKTAQGARVRAAAHVRELMAAAELDFQVSEVAWPRALAYLQQMRSECELDVNVITVEIEQ